MKTTTLILILFLTGPGLWAQTPPAQRPPQVRARTTNSPAQTPPAARAPVFVPPPVPSPAIVSALAQPPAIAPADSTSNGGTNEVPGYVYDFPGVDANQVLTIYSKLVGRTLLRAQVSSPPIILVTQSPLTRAEAIEALQAVLSLNGIEVINIGDKFVKVLPPDQAAGSGAKLDSSDASQLPELGTYVTHIVHLNFAKPSALVPIITPFSKLPNAILPLDDNGILVLRDNAENVKRMLELIEQVDVGGASSEIISEVIPIRYALAGDIANALNSLGGSGGGTVSIGGAVGTSTTGGTRPGGIQSNQNYQPGGNGVGTQPRTMGIGSTIGSTPNGTPSSGSTFQSRLLSIVNNAAQAGGGKQESIQLFGQTKIIADQRSNSLLIFATRSDMDAITNVIAKLDVLLSQVLIESVIIDVDLNKGMSMGVSVAQNPKVFSSKQGGIAGGGGSVNGPTFFNFLSANSTFNNGTNSSAILGNALSSGLSYFGNIGPTWDLALQAAASDSSATVIQRPRIQTSQAKAASFFVGSTVPYITSSYNGGSGIGQSSSYSQLSVGVSLDVTPFINPDGLVVMDIDQEIDDLAGTTAIEGVGDVPNTTKRTLQSEIAVKDKDTVMLGGFIRSDRENSKNGVPFLQDIPLIGNLFTQRSNSKDRKETIVLIRPTVLRTPDIAAMQAVTEQTRLPGIYSAAAEDARDERKLSESAAKAEAQAEAAESKAGKKGAKPDAANGSGAYDSSGFFIPAPPTSGTIDTNNIMSPNP